MKTHLDVLSNSDDSGLIPCFNLSKSWLTLSFVDYFILHSLNCSHKNRFRPGVEKLRVSRETWSCSKFSGGLLECMCVRGFFSFFLLTEHTERRLVCKKKTRVSCGILHPVLISFIFKFLLSGCLNRMYVHC